MLNKLLFIRDAGDTGFSHNLFFRLLDFQLNRFATSDTVRLPAMSLRTLQ